MSTKYILIIQCEISHNRCSGFHCANEFNTRNNLFAQYDDNVKYLSFTCGGCCGKAVSQKLEHLVRKAYKKADLKQKDFTIHLASCITHDNRHSDRCLFINNIKKLIHKNGFDKIVEGTYISKKAEEKRTQGLYKTYKDNKNE